VLMNTEDSAAELHDECRLTIADRWIRGRLGQALRAAREGFAAYRFDLAAQAMYEFVWYEFCDWYLELSKPMLQAPGGDPALQRGTRRTLLEVLEASLRMLHPLMPFVTEEIWLRVGPLAGHAGPTIMLQPYPAAAEFPVDGEAERQVGALQAVVLGIRQIRGELDVPHSRATPVYVRTDRPGDAQAIELLAGAIGRVANIESVTVVASEADLPPCAIAIIDGRTVLAPFDRLIEDVSAEIGRLQKRQARTAQDRDRSVAKLANESFVANAPEAVVARERDRIAEFDRQLSQLAEQLRRLSAVRSAESEA
jgi:valyl-tRNA synthetase